MEIKSAKIPVRCYKAKDCLASVILAYESDTMAIRTFKKLMLIMMVARKK